MSNVPTTLTPGRGASGAKKGGKKNAKKGGKKPSAGRGSVAALKTIFGDRQTMAYRALTGATFLSSSAYAGYRFGSTGKSMRSVFEIDGKENILSKYVDPRLAVGGLGLALGAWKRDKTYGRVAFAMGTGLLLSWGAEFANDMGFKAGNKNAKEGPAQVPAAPIQTPAVQTPAAQGVAMIDASGRFVFSEVGRREGNERKEDRLERRIARLVQELRSLDPQAADRFLAAQLSPAGQRALTASTMYRPPMAAAYGYDEAAAIY